jgi:hypothetical protein
VNPLVAFLRARAEQSLPGPLNALPRPVKRGIGVVAPLVPGPLGLLGSPGGQLGMSIAPRLMDADQAVARALTGALLLGNARLNPAIRANPASPGGQMAGQASRAYGQGSGNVLARLIAANEAAAQGGASAGIGPFGTSTHAVATGLLNAETDPMNLLGPAGKLAEAAKLGQLARVLGIADRAQNLPGEALGKVAAPVAGRLLAGLADRQAAKAAIRAGESLAGLPRVPVNLPTQLPLGAAPKPPPVQIPLRIERDVPLPPRATLADLLPREAVTPGQEAAAKAATYGHPDLLPPGAAPDLPGYAGQTRREALGALTSDEIDHLVNLAYPVEKAQANAINAHRDPLDLADAALARIQQPGPKGQELVARLQQLHPDLAEKIAFLPDPEDVAAEFGGDLAAGGGGFGLVPARLGTTLAGAGVGSGVGGLAGGGLGLAAGHRDDQLKEDVAAGAGLGALAGGSVGSVSPEIAAYARQFAAQAGPELAGRMEGSYLTDPDMIGDVLTVMKRAQGEEGLAPGSVNGIKDAWSAFANYWKRQAVNTPKQLPQDAAQRTLTLEGAGLRQEFPGYGHQAIQQWQKRLSAERVGRVSTVDNPVVAMFRALGQEKLLGDLPSIDGIDYGGSLETQGKRFGPLGRTVAGGLIGLASGVKKVNPVSPVLGMARGFLDPAIDAGIRHANGIQHDAARYAMREAAMPRDFPALADRFLGELADRGVDVAPLAAKGGFFSPEEVAALAGPDAGKAWGQRAEELIRAQGNRIAFLNGDFRESSRLPGEKWFTKAVPFSSWAIHYAPVLAEIAARHPVATIHVLRELDREKAEAGAQGKQAYQSGITISDRTPLVGLAARVRNGGGAGTLTMNPIGSLVPFSDIGGGGQPLPEDATGYQRLTDLTGRVGFQPNPLIQSLAYVAGQGRAPAALSRTAGMEGLADTAPVLVRALLRGTGNPDLADRVPDLAMPGGRTILDAARGVVAPAVEQAGLPATGGGPSDPAERRYAEIVLARTGKPLSDPSNRGLLETMGSTDNPLWQMALLQSRAAGAVGNAASLTSPVQTTAQTSSSAAAQAAPKLPYSSYAISQAPKAAQPAMLAANAAAARANPASAAYTNISGKSRTDQLVSQWEREHLALKRVNPTYYAQRLKEYKASLR